MSATMRAAVISAPRDVRFLEVPVPAPGARQVRLRVEGCGVCASNLGPWKGLPWTSYPLAPGEAGHEAWGRVDAIGEDVEDVELGARVAVLSNHAYAPFALADADTVVRLPAALDGLPFPGEAFACAINIFERSRVQPGDVVAIVGVGFLGAILTRLASRAGADVIAISRRESSLHLATAMGAKHRIVMDDHARIVQTVHELTAGRLCDRVIECVGAPWPLDLASDLTGVRGTLVIAGYHQDGPRQVNVQQWNWRGIDVVNAHERDPSRYVQGMRRAVEAMVDGTLDPRRFVTHRYPLADLAQALDDTDSKPAGFVKAVVIP